MSAVALEDRQVEIDERQVLAVVGLLNVLEFNKRRHRIRTLAGRGVRLDGSGRC
jgi:hypothetical protein